MFVINLIQDLGAFLKILCWIFIRNLAIPYEYGMQVIFRIVKNSLYQKNNLFYLPFFLSFFLFFFYVNRETCKWKIKEKKDVSFFAAPRNWLYTVVVKCINPKLHGDAFFHYTILLYINFIELNFFHKRYHPACVKH